MQREGSALHGIGVVVLKELNDHLTSVRMRVLEWLVVLVGMLAVYFAVDRIRQVVAEDPFLFLRLFTTAPEVIPIAFLHILSILVPLIAIGLGFDAINSEHNRRTLSRILAQPIYRDALLFGKFAAGLLTITISLLALWLIVIGFGLLMLGVPPNAEEMARAFVFLLVTIAYAGVWLALAMLFSVVFRSPATAALVTLGVWFFFWLLWPVIAQMLAAIIAPPDPGYSALGLDTPATLEWSVVLSRLSPTTLFGEIAAALLNPEQRALGPIYLAQLQGAVRGPLPLAQSVMIAWPQMVGLIAGSIVLFIIGYIAFQRQEVRA
jgi:ABC-2 type transport system permease protein